MKSLPYILAAGLVVFAADSLAASKSPSETGHGQPAAAEHGQTAAAEQSTDSAPGHGATTPRKAKKSGGAPHWAYAGDIGPGSWGALAADFELCGSGAMQSPINLNGRDGVNANGESIEFDYRLTPLRVLHNGHTVQVNYAPGSSIMVGGKRYELLQFHFHTPSEHKVGGAAAAMEMHFVHVNVDGELAVVGLLMDSGEENLALREIWAAMPKRATPERVHDRVVLNGRDLLPADTSYYRYMGSLTTPPCSQGVNWYVLNGRIEVSPEQVHQFAESAGPNARPVQALNHRLLLAPPAIN